MLRQRKWYYGVLLILGISALGGCGKNKKNVSESAYLVEEEAYSANYSCKDKDGRDIMGNKVVYRIEQQEEMTEEQKLEVIVGLVEKSKEESDNGTNVMSKNVIEAEAQWKDLNGKEKIYLLRGEKLESYVTVKDGKEIYRDRGDVE